MRRAIVLPALLLGLILGALLVATIRIGDWFDGPDPETIATASLQSMREQARLTPFTARFVAVVTSSQNRFGLTAQKTLILPGTVRYEIDLARLRQRDLRWDEGGKTLTVSLPALELAGPEIDLGEIREYGGGGILTAITGAEQRLDEANRSQARQELLRQARQPMPMRLAREAARRAVERSFAMPLKAAGVEARVVARFPEEGSKNSSRLDSSRSVEDVLREQKAHREAAGRP